MRNQRSRLASVGCWIQVPLILALACVAASGSARAQDNQRFPNAHEPPPQDWPGPIFELSQDYPTTHPEPENWPWQAFDFKTQPTEYLKAVLDYVYEGNLAANWRVQNNCIRKWYHAPWLHSGNAGREFIHGMTRERPSRAGELAPTQTSVFQNWAVGFYNPPGGFIIGKVWEDAQNPQVSQARFPNGTVSAKLLFTAATEEEVPFLEGTFRWQGNINPPTGGNSRSPQDLRLLQIDVAVRDVRADDTTGWVFGTFIYHKDHAGATPWEKMRPVGLMWGNDPGVTEEMVAAGTELQETWRNPDVTLQHYGWAGRLNGPVDNPISSCLSCHSTAQIPSSAPMNFPPNTTDNAVKLRWFRNIAAGQPFSPGAISADYSLQTSRGILNFRLSLLPPAPPAGAIPALAEAAPSDSPESDESFMIDGQKYYPVTR